MDEAYTMKKKILSFICIGFLIGVVVCYAMYEGVTRTSGEKFCIVCHEMAPMLASYHNDVHGGAGKMGIKAQCVDCHMPHNNIFNYIFTKAKNGVVEGYIHFFKDVDQINWLENRKNRLRFVFDDGCLKCHANFQNLPEISPKGKQMHEHYTSLLNTDKKIGCASCH
ncbi:NapC/NirT family cytochrome c, partial [Campylobacter sp. RM12327]|nr:NapC/NirT family cytochrome c [Campylobacter sp. RM12327]